MGWRDGWPGAWGALGVYSFSLIRFLGGRAFPLAAAAPFVRPLRGLPFAARPRSAATEAAWHRRARRTRQAARALLAVANARTVLAAHHGGGMGGGGRNGGGKNGGKGGGAGSGIAYEDWSCSLCDFYNFGWRSRCKSCEASPPGGARVAKGKGKGGTGSLGTGGGVGGIASKQLQLAEQARRGQQRAADKAREESKREIERLRKELAEAKRAAASSGGAAVVDMAGEDDEDDAADTDAEKEQQLAAEVKALETSLGGLPEAAPFRVLTQKRIDEAREELQAIRDRKGGPGAKVLGAASKHQKELRSARNRLLKRTKAQERVEAQVEELEEQLGRVRDQLKEKAAELKTVREEVQEAHDELQRLTGTSAGEGDAEGKGAGDQSTLGGRTQAAQLLEQLATMLPPSLEQQLKSLHDAAVQHQLEQQRIREQQVQQQQQQQQQQQLAAAAAAAAATTAAAVPAAAGTQQQPTDQQLEGEEEAMDDLDPSTLELVGALQSVLEAAESETPPAADADGGIGGCNARRATLVEHLKRKGTTSAKLQGVIRDFKKKQKGKPDLKDLKSAGVAGQGGKGDDTPAPPQA